MISSACENNIRSLCRPAQLQDTLVQEYLTREIATRSICPLCGEELQDYADAGYHLYNTHPQEMATEKCSRLLDPLLDLRELEVMQRIINPEVVGIGQYFGDIISSKFNQHAMVNIIGKTGTGKSNAAMDIAVKVSNYLAKKMGGKPEDFFTMANVAIMRLETIIPILKELDKKRYNIFILDDIGGEWGARNAQTKQNKEINKIIQTFRDTNTLVIFTMPDSFLIDKVGRKLAHYQIEMTQKLFGHGVSLGKIKLVKESYQKGTTYFVFPQINGVQYKKIMFQRVPEEIASAYEAKREGIRKQFTADSISTLSGEGGDKTRKGETVKKYIEIAPLINADLMDNPSISNRALARKHNVNPATIKNAKDYLAGGD